MLLWHKIFLKKKKNRQNSAQGYSFEIILHILQVYLQLEEKAGQSVSPSHPYCFPGKLLVK